MANNEGRRSIRWGGVCLDCADAEELAAFYRQLLGWEITARDEPDARLGGSGWIGMADPSGGVSLSFQAETWYEAPTWPELSGAQSKMIHLEIDVDDMEDAVARVIAAGGIEAPQQPADRDGSQLRVMIDPAGHPFCLVADEPA
jgi:predicted enzyme related to lactoylglutathione lyase